MTKTRQADNRATNWARWTARGIGSLVSAYWLLMGIAYGIGEPMPLEPESAIMAILIVASTIGVLVAWWRERAGGIMLAVCAIAQGVFAYLASGHNRGFAVLIAGGPYLLISVLFLLSSRRSGAGERNDG